MKLNTQRLAAGIAGIWMFSAATAGELFAYPPTGRSDAQQQQDQFECHQWAVEQSKFDPVQFAAQGSRASVAAQPASNPNTQNKAGGAVVAGAAQGAVIGEVAKGEAGKGAAAGATLGVFRARVAERHAAEERAAAQAQAMQTVKQEQSVQAADLQAKQQAYQRARSTCFRARGYTVSE